MTTEEKAKRYDEAIERAKSLIDFCSDSELKTLEHVFHELKESEDERIKEWLIGYFKSIFTIDGVPQSFDNGLSVKDVIAWLEKQGEQKPTDWKPDDEQMKALDIAIRCGIQLGTWEETALKSLKAQLIHLKKK